MALTPPKRAAPSYLTENLQAVVEAELFDPVEGEVEIIPGLTVVPAPGHTPHHQIVLLHDGNSVLAFWGDLFPTSRHVHPPYVMAFDLQPAVALEEKTRWLERAVREEWIWVWTHEPTALVARVRMEAEKPVVEPISSS